MISPKFHKWLSECKIEAYKVEGMAPKAWYGISHFEPMTGCYVLYPIPINCIVALSRYVYRMIKTGFMLWRSPYEREIRRAYKRGKSDAVDEMNEAMDKAAYSKNRTV